jgi:hypothetical protein
MGPFVFLDSPPSPPNTIQVVKTTALYFTCYVVKIKIKKKAPWYYGRVSWLLGEGQQLPWLLFSRNLQGE